MATQLQLRRGTTTEHTSFTGAVGEVTVDTTKDMLVVHDGATAGGFPQAAKANADGTISLVKKDGTSAGSINSSGLFNDTLTSTNTDQALTAAQGKVLKDTKLDASLAFGVGQAWVDVTSSRAKGVEYTNSSERMIMVSICLSDTASGDPSVSVTVGGVVIITQHYDSGSFFGSTNLQFLVPPAATYQVDITSSGVFNLWTELQ